MVRPSDTPRFLLSLTFLATLLAASACDAPTAGKPAERIATNAAPIIGGQVDTAHPEVVAVLGPNFSCSGTIVQVKNGRGYVLTAAHCCPAGNLPDQVVIGQDYQTGQAHPIISGSVTRDACYDNCPGSTDDVCMLQFNAPAGTQAIPVLQPGSDTLTAGTNLTYVGYGLTSSPPGGFNSVRRVVTKPIDTIDAYFISYANPSVSGTCEGDSGGPGIAIVNGSQFVAGVTSYGDQACTMLGVSIRASAVYADFIAPYLADSAPTPKCPKATDCNVCSQESTNPQCNGGCASTVSACNNDAACSALIQCYNGCSTLACQNGCNTQHVAGLQKYEAISACVCAGSCATPCANIYCGVTSCGLYIGTASNQCQTCFQDKCCAQAWTCSQDPSCKACFGPQPPASCATNPNAQAFFQCAGQNCAAPTCNFPTPSSTTSTTGAATSATGAGGGASAGQTTAAATTGAGGGGSGGGSSSGCGCVVAGEAGASNLTLGFLALALGALARFRRRR